MNKLDYAQSVILARVYEKRLLGKSKIDRMIDAANAEDSFKILMDSEYSKSANGVFDVYSYVELLNQETARVRDIAEELLKDKNVFDIMTLKYEYHNLKVIVKSKFANKDLSEKFIQSKHSNPQLIQAQVLADKYSNIKEEYAQALIEAISEYEKTKDPQMIDIIIDNHYFAHILKLLKLVDSEFFGEYILSEIDFYNVIALLRMQKMKRSQFFAQKVIVEGGRITKEKILSLFQADIEKIISVLKGEKIGSYIVKGLDFYKETGSLFLIEKLGKKYFEDFNKDSRFITFGPEPIIAYILAKEKEIEEIRVILVGKLNGISPSKIRERLGE